MGLTSERHSPILEYPISRSLFKFSPALSSLTTFSGKNLDKMSVLSASAFLSAPAIMIDNYSKGEHSYHARSWMSEEEYWAIIRLSNKRRELGQKARK